MTNLHQTIEVDGALCPDCSLLKKEKRKLFWTGKELACSCGYVVPVAVAIQTLEAAPQEVRDELVKKWGGVNQYAAGFDYREGYENAIGVLARFSSELGAGVGCRLTSVNDYEEKLRWGIDQLAPKVEVVRARRKALEEASLVICRYCRDGLDITEKLNDYWHGDRRCIATPIRKLIDSEKGDDQ